MVFISSKVGSIADNTSGGAYLYRSSKTALNMAVKSLSLDLSDKGIICILLHPGWVKTDMGGSSALIDAATSVAGMRAVIDRATSADSGRFFNYDGNELPW
jgi:NAD(P)-dependent dehydrogenase (short-subunit alcohol dehydrogenase family)